MVLELTDSFEVIVDDIIVTVEDSIHNPPARCVWILVDDKERRVFEIVLAMINKKTIKD